MEKILHFYKTPNGKVPFEVWLNQLKKKNKKHHIAIISRLNRITEKGLFGDYKPLGEGVFELRFFIGPGLRIYFGEDGDLIVVLLCAGDKSTQQKDIEQAKNYWRQYNARQK